MFEDYYSDHFSFPGTSMVSNYCHSPASCYVRGGVWQSNDNFKFHSVELSKTIEVPKLPEITENSIMKIVNEDPFIQELKVKERKFKIKALLWLINVIKWLTHIT